MRPPPVPEDKSAEIVRAVVYSGLSPAAARCWLRIFFCEAGALDVFEVVTHDLGNEASELIEAGWLRVVRTRVTAVNPVAMYGALTELKGDEKKLAALAKPSLKGADAVIAESNEELFAFYNEQRRKAGIGPVGKSKTHNKFLARIQRWALDNKVDLTEFFEWSRVRTRFTKQPYPTLTLLAGEWIQGEWLSRDPESEAAFGHAGKTYASPESDLGAKLAAAGLGKWDTAMLRHIAKEAKTARELPHMRTPSSDEQLEAAVRWVAAQEDEDDG